MTNRARRAPVSPTPEQRAPRHNLPAQPTPLIGRDRDVATVIARLRHPDLRLLTLTGAPGTGKTRLALAAATALLDDYADGVWFAALDAVRDAGLVPAAVAAALDVREEGSLPLPALLAAALRDRQTLLVLDNFEHVLPAAVLVADLLAACPRL